MVEGDLDGAVQQQEADGGDRRGAVDGLGEKPLARAEEEAVGGHQAPDHGRGEGDQAQDAGREVQGDAETVAAREDEQGYQDRAPAARTRLRR
ncbi:hypothetical protein SALBM135S_04937 [Streptomyces alboniger]